MPSTAEGEDVDQGTDLTPDAPTGALPQAMEAGVAEPAVSPSAAPFRGAEASEASLPAPGIEAPPPLEALEAPQTPAADALAGPQLQPLEAEVAAPPIDALQEAPDQLVDALPAESDFPQLQPPETEVAAPPAEGLYEPQAPSADTLPTEAPQLQPREVDVAATQTEALGRPHVSDSPPLATEASQPEPTGLEVAAPPAEARQEPQEQPPAPLPAEAEASQPEPTGLEVAAPPAEARQEPQEQPPAPVPAEAEAPQPEPTELEVAAPPAEARQEPQEQPPAPVPAEAEAPQLELPEVEVAAPPVEALGEPQAPPAGALTGEDRAAEGEPPQSHGPEVEVAAAEAETQQGVPERPVAALPTEAPPPPSAEAAASPTLTAARPITTAASAPTFRQQDLLRRLPPARPPSLPSREAMGRLLPYLRLALRGAAAVAIGLAVTVLALVVLYRWVDPPTSTLMFGQRLAGARIERLWVPLDRISPHLVKAVILSEDGAFCRHRGVDWTALGEAIEDDRGGSTITMQVVKNLFLWPSRSYVRKAIEIGLAYLVELIWPKRRILEIYLNIAEWGDGVFGAEAAARQHFRKSAARLTRGEAALLAVALPNPAVRRPGRPGPGMRRLGMRLLVRMTTSRARLGCVRAPRRPATQTPLVPARRSGL